MPLTAVIGTGSWGAATAMALVRNGADVLLWGRDPAKVSELARTRRHPLLPQGALPNELRLSSDPTTLAAADLVLWAVPTQHSAAQARALAPHLAPHAPVISLSKGFEQGTLRRVSEVLAAALGQRDYGALSGPSHAAEVIAGLPACLVLAGSEALCERAHARLHGRLFRLYTSTDLLGVEIAGALKNVVAIAAGIGDGLRLGDNLKAALVTRGLAEMRRLGRALGAREATFAGLAGIGDLIATCCSAHGRNRALGEALARGHEAQAYLAAQKTVAEGAWTCRAALELGQRYGVELPIASQVASVIWHAKQVPSAMDDLLSRTPKEEDA